MVPTDIEIHLDANNRPKAFNEALLDAVVVSDPNNQPVFCANDEDSVLRKVLRQHQQEMRFRDESNIVLNTPHESLWQRLIKKIDTAAVHPFMKLHSLSNCYQHPEKSKKKSNDMHQRQY